MQLPPQILGGLRGNSYLCRQNLKPMATTEKTPLWLELKKDYIDDNFSKLHEVS